MVFGLSTRGLQDAILIDVLMFLEAEWMEHGTNNGCKIDFMLKWLETEQVVFS